MMATYTESRLGEAPLDADAPDVVGPTDENSDVTVSVGLIVVVALRVIVIVVVREEESSSSSPPSVVLSVVSLLLGLTVGPVPVVGVGIGIGIGIGSCAIDVVMVGVRAAMGMGGCVGAMAALMGIELIDVSSSSLVVSVGEDVESEKRRSKEVDLYRIALTLDEWMGESSDDSSVINEVKFKNLTVIAVSLMLALYTSLKIDFLRG
ncbi:hypothetical protein RRF57_003700 [Xylaria bambusicola]|uniref:Uncharacterized protein n=1 Tax=Xylaria bambusicola TaxID=326684 RepID=A0AAN7U9C7_9PEZI